MKQASSKQKKMALTDTFFHQVIESLEDYAVFTTDLQGVVTSWNTGAERLLGYSEREIIGKNALLFFTPEDIERKEPEKELKNALTKGRAYDERFHVMKSGARFWASGLVFPLKDEKGNIQGFTKIMRNRSQLRLVEGRLSQLAAIVESSNDAIISRDLMGIIQTWNKGAERLFGYTAKEVIGKHISLTIPSDVKEEIIKSDELEKYQGIPIVFDSVRKRKDGSRVNVAVTISPIKDARGKLTGASIIARDDTDRKRAEESLAEMAAIVAASDDAIIRRTLDGIITHWNYGATKLYGYTTDEAIGKSVQILIPKEKMHDLEDISKHLTRGEPMKHFETKRLRKDGTLVDVSISLSPIKDAKGNITGVSTIARDITERKFLERQKDDFIGIASHELKTPVTSLKVYAQVLHRRFIKTEDAVSAELIQRIEVQLNKLTNLIGDLLDVTKIEGGKLQFNEGYFDFNELVSEIVEEMQRTTEDHTIVTKLQKTKTIFGDRDRVGQVIINLISNAIKYSPKASEVIVTTEFGENNVTLCVRDFGVGISKEKQEKVFERFYRVSGPHDQTFPGLGLGLYISSEIIKRLGGRIWVTSTKGKGSTFCFNLPVEKKKTRVRNSRVG